MAGSDINAAWNALPSDGQSAGGGNDAIQDVKQTFEARIAKEAMLDLTELSHQPQQGRARAGAARCYYQNTAPTTTPDGLQALSAIDYGRLWINSDTGEVKEYTASGWVVSRAGEVVKACYVSASAPSNPAPAEGLLWFDTTNNVLCCYTSGAWSRIGSKCALSAPGSPVNGDMWVA